MYACPVRTFFNLLLAQPSPSALSSLQFVCSYIACSVLHGSTSDPGLSTCLLHLEPPSPGRWPVASTMPPRPVGYICDCHPCSVTGLPCPSSSTLVSCRLWAYVVDSSLHPLALLGSSFPLASPQSSAAPTLPKPSSTLASPQLLIHMVPSRSP